MKTILKVIWYVVQIIALLVVGYVFTVLVLSTGL